MSSMVSLRWTPNIRRFLGGSGKENGNKLQEVGVDGLGHTMGHTSLFLSFFWEFWGEQLPQDAPPITVFSLTPSLKQLIQVTMNGSLEAASRNKNFFL